MSRVERAMSTWLLSSTSMQGASFEGEPTGLFTPALCSTLLNRRSTTGGPFATAGLSTTATGEARIA